MHVLVSMPQLLTEAWIKDPDSVSEEFARLWRELKTDLMILASTKVQRSVIDLQQIYSNDFTARWGELAEQNSARNEDERRGFDQVWMKAFDEVMGPPLRRLAQAMRRELRLGRDEPPMVFS